MLGCIQPMSSPMMKRMLGFACCCCCCACCCCGRGGGSCCCCCAVAGRLAAIPAATNAGRASHNFRMAFMEDLLTFRLGRGKNDRTTPCGIVLLQTRGSLYG